MLNCAIDSPKILGNFEHRQESPARRFYPICISMFTSIANLAKKPHMAQYPRGSRDEAHTSKFRGRTMKRMPGMCKKEDRKGDAKTSIR